MSKISLSPDASGTGIFTIASPNSNTNRTLTLPDDTGTIVTNSGNQAGSFTTLNTSGAVVFNDAGADVDFRVEGDTEANLLFVDASTDRVGVGTSSPSYRTDIRGASTTLLNVEGTSTAGDAETVFRLSQPATNVSANNEIRSGVTSGQNPYLSFAVRESNSPFATVERMRIDTSGRLLVGTTNTAIEGSTAGGSGFVYNPLGIGAFARNTASKAFSISKTSAVGNGTFVEFFYNGSTIGTISHTTTATSYVTSSDYRLKENVAPMTGALAKVQALNPVTYTWKADGSAGEGFIAHELQEVAPYAVSGEKDGEEMQGVDYGKITPLLTAALQEAITEIQSLKARVAELEAK